MPQPFAFGKYSVASAGVKMPGGNSGRVSADEAAAPDPAGGEGPALDEDARLALPASFANAIFCLSTLVIFNHTLCCVDVVLCQDSLVGALATPTMGKVLGHLTWAPPRKRDRCRTPHNSSQTQNENQRFGYEMCTKST